MKSRLPETRSGGWQLLQAADCDHAQGHSRRRFLTLAAAGAVSGLGVQRALAAPSESGRVRTLRLTTSGGDRATGYVMSNKIARRDGHLVCTWLDVERQNRWALVDVARGEILRTGAVGPRRTDNHCGAALATDTDGTLHLLIGAHHGSFVHYRWASGQPDWEPVEDGRAVGQSATYPSLVCDGRGTLHLMYRRETNGRDAHLVYWRRPKQGPWSGPHLLVRLAVSEHSWLTNALEAGASGRLHVVCSNTLPVPAQGADARYYGASHLYSDDAGRTWRQFADAKALALPADAGQLQRIDGSALTPERIEAHYGGPRGPLHSYHHKMVLSNPVVDDSGRPWVIVHNVLAGDAELYRHDETGPWVGTSLAAAVRALLPGYHIRHCGQLSRQRDGTIQAVLMVSPVANVGWGANGTTLVRLEFDAAGRVVRQSVVSTPEPDLAHWLPSLERWCWHAPVDKPALLYTRGVNAGGYSNNVNSVKTEVWVEQL
jgi:hypothetical protein